MSTHVHMPQQFYCPLCGNYADQLFTGAICGTRDCPNYDVRMLIDEIKTQLEEELPLSWAPFILYP